MTALRRALKSRSGMTLIELILAMILLAIIGTTVAASLVPTLRAYNYALSVSEMNTLLDNVSRDVLSDIATAREITVTDTGELIIKNDLLTVSYGINDEGYLYRNDKTMPLLAKGYYKKKTLTMEYQTLVASTTPGEDDTVQALAPGVYGKDSKFNILLRISLFDDGEWMVTRSYAAKPLGLNQYDVKEESDSPFS